MLDGNESNDEKRSSYFLNYDADDKNLYRNKFNVKVLNQHTDLTIFRTFARVYSNCKYIPSFESGLIDPKVIARWCVSRTIQCLKDEYSYQRFPCRNYEELGYTKESLFNNVVCININGLTAETGDSFLAIPLKSADYRKKRDDSLPLQPPSGGEERVSSANVDGRSIFKHNRVTIPHSGAENETEEIDLIDLNSVASDICDRLTEYDGGGKTLGGIKNLQTLIQRAGEKSEKEKEYLVKGGGDGDDCQSYSMHPEFFTLYVFVDFEYLYGLVWNLLYEYRGLLDQGAAVYFSDPLQFNNTTEPFDELKRYFGIKDNKNNLTIDGVHSVRSIESKTNLLQWKRSRAVEKRPAGREINNDRHKVNKKPKVREKKTTELVRGFRELISNYANDPMLNNPDFRNESYRIDRQLNKDILSMKYVFSEKDIRKRISFLLINIVTILFDNSTVIVRNFLFDNSLPQTNLTSLIGPIKVELSKNLNKDILDSTLDSDKNVQKHTKTDKLQVLDRFEL